VRIHLAAEGFEVEGFPRHCSSIVVDGAGLESDPRREGAGSPHYGTVFCDQDEAVAVS
jgi:hypothetical protein